MSETKETILSILIDKGENLTDGDLKKIDSLLEELESNGDLDFMELDSLKYYVDRVVGQISIEPNTKLSADGRT
jgi:hypothetical protein